MTPGARVAAAIEILDDILAGVVPEKALTGWGRSHRFAGSKDRAAIRDNVFSALRCRASFAWLGGAETGRGIMLGAMRSAGLADEMFSGEGHAPAVAQDEEQGQTLDTAPRSVRLDMPDWLLPHFDAALEEDTEIVLTQLQERAGIFLRVNLARTTVSDAADRLRADGIETTPLLHISSALQVIGNERKIAQSSAYLDGLVELQDTASQDAIEKLGITPNLRVLDYCAGGGGKSLAMAALGAHISAHDIDARRMKDIAPRAKRAGCAIDILTTDELKQTAPFDLVFCDAPCSGSGTWRRTPAAKWDLTPDRLDELTRMQLDVLNAAKSYVRVGGTLAYATCSVFEVENSDRVEAFLKHAPQFAFESDYHFTPHSHGDGFYLSTLQRVT